MNFGPNYGGRELYITNKVQRVITEDEEAQIIQKFDRLPEKIFILQLISTEKNTLILSSCLLLIFIITLAFGRIYSWGAVSPVLGRKAESEAEASRIEMIITLTAHVVQIAGGRQHVLALDRYEQVWSWGRNDFGQLGHEDTDIYPLPKEIEYFKKQPVVQIYTGEDSSFAVTKSGFLYVWGDNRNFQLGILGTYHQEPKLMIHTPWEGNRDQKIVYGKNNIGIIFNFNFGFSEEDDDKQDITKKDDKNIKDTTNKDQELKLAELEVKISDMECAIYGKKTQALQITEKSIKEDKLLKEIGYQIQKLNSDYNSRQATMQLQENQIVQIEKDLSSIKSQLVEIQKKETDLINQREEYDSQLRKLIKNQGQSQEIEDIIKDQKRIKELLMANDNIKNTLIKRQNENEEQKTRKFISNGNIRDELQEIQQRVQLFQDCEVDRKKNLKTMFLEENKAELEKFMVKIHFFFKAMFESNVNEIAKKSTYIIGLDKIMKDSCDKIQFIKNEMLGIKISQNDGSYEILSKVLEILSDNLATRNKLNDYIQGLLMQVSQKHENFINDFKFEYDTETLQERENEIEKQRNYIELITRQQNEISERSKQMRSVRAYERELKKKFNVVENKKRGCFG